MIINYSIEKEDFLTHQLYVASKSERIKKKRKKSRIRIPIIYTVIALLFLLGKSTLIGIFLLLVGILWFFIYPIWERRHYVNHYNEYIDESFKERFNKSVSVEFTDEFILTKEKAGESKIAITELDKISEISSVFLVTLKGGQSLMIPKKQISDIEQIKNFLKKLSHSLNVPYHSEVNWKWK